MQSLCTNYQLWYTDVRVTDHCGALERLNSLLENEKKTKKQLCKSPVNLLVHVVCDVIFFPVYRELTVNIDPNECDVEVSSQRPKEEPGTLCQSNVLIYETFNAHMGERVTQA